MKAPKSLDGSLNDVKYEQYVNNLHDRLPQLTDPSDVDCKRWPWELLQNAKDTVVKRPNPADRFVDIVIKYYTDSNGEKILYFEHNGDQFTNKAITGLIWKFSAEKRNEQTTEDGLTRDKQSTGRFGTGFMTTHALSLTVDVSGSLFHDDPDVMRNVSVDFTLHREGPDDSSYKDGVDKTERELRENMGKRSIPEGGVLPTRFTYHLNKEASEKAAIMGLTNVKANAAQTMLFCPSVRSITIIDEVNDDKFKITKRDYSERRDVVKETIFLEEYSDLSPKIRRFISIEIEEYSEPISSHWKVKDRNLRLHLAVEVDKDNNILPIPGDSPAVYCSLPLIGFESMSLPFYINSNDFEPATERTSLYLKKKRFEYRLNEDTDEDEKYFLQSGINWSIFERAIPLYECIVDYLIANEYKQRYNLINGLGSIFKSGWEKDTKNCLASRVILPLRTMLITKDLIRTAVSYRSLDSDIKFVECAKDCDLHELYSICKTIYGDNMPCEDENACWVSLKWSRFTFEAEFEEKVPESENPGFPTVKYDQIADYIEESGTINNLILDIEESSIPSNSSEDEKKIFILNSKLEWLNRFYKWVLDSKVTNLSNKKLVPNRNGEFCSTEQGCELKDAGDIPMAIFDFMKQIDLNWDNKLLMLGVKHITLTKETKDNIIVSIKNRAKEIREDVKYNSDGKLIKLLPILFALPEKEDERVADFLNKRTHILSILKVMYPDKCQGIESVTLGLKAETWEDTDRWFMTLVASELANRKHLDVIAEDDSEDIIKTKYCTSDWLSRTLNFMFQRSYLHQEDISFNEEKTETLALVPNRDGVFCFINKLFTQGQIPDELLDPKLSKTGFDINSVLIYKGFNLNEKVAITDFPISTLASEYNKFFAGNCSEDDKLAVSAYLIHLVPNVGDQYMRTRNLYNTYIQAKEEDKKTCIISVSDLNLWKGCNEFLIKYLCDKASELASIHSIGVKVADSYEEVTDEFDYSVVGLSWLNDLITESNKHKVEIDDELNLIPDWYGNLQNAKDVVYNGEILNSYYGSDSLVRLVDSKLWEHYPMQEKQEGDDNITKTIVHPDYCLATDFQNNTDERLFDLVDRLVDYCSEHNSSDWRQILKSSIETLLNFFENNISRSKLNMENHILESKLKKLFPNTYCNRKSLSYDFIFDAETKARISQMNENYSVDEIESLIKNKDFLKKILNTKDLSNIQKIMEEFPHTKFGEILNILRNEQGEFSTESYEQRISNERKREIGDKGECYVYEMLCRQYDSANVRWSNYAPSDINARLVEFQGRVYPLITTMHDYDFIVFHNGKTIYIEVKTTVGSLNNSKDFPLIFETKEWEWIENVQNLDQESLHYIVRVFDIEGNPKVYFLKQETKMP